MAHKLADETLAIILAQSLAVSDADFACTSASKSPFASDALSSSTILLVCKRWMRVATPLLYETVVLRSIPQATALASALKANRDFGRYIRKVRVEGGVGASICSVFKAAPNITDLAVTLDLFATDNVSHMYKSLLEAVAPRRLVLCSAQFRLNKNKVTALAVETLCKCIVEWTTLRVVVLSEGVAVRCSPIYQAICRAPQLNMIHIPHSGHLTSLHDDFLSTLAESCSAPIVRIGWRAQGTGLLGIPEDRLEKLSPRAREKVRFAEPLEQIPDVLPINPSFTPLAKTSPTTRCEIWTRILEIVITHTSGIDDSKLSADRWAPNNSGIRLPRGPVRQCMLVCKEWKDIATPLACRNVRLRTWRTFKEFEALLTANEDAHLHELVRSLIVGGNYLARENDISRIEKALPSFLRQFSYLEALDARSASVSPIILDALTSTAASHLRKLNLRSTEPGTYVLPSLPRLSQLCWRAENREIKFLINQLTPTFPALEELNVSGIASGQLLRTLTKCSIPSLREFEFDGDCDVDGVQTFCSAHGGKLRRVRNTGYLDMFNTILYYGPMVTSLDFGSGLMPPDDGGLAMLDGPHTALEELIIPSLDCLERVGSIDDDDPEIELLERLLEELLPERFPALRTIRIMQCDIWPTTQRKIAKHPMPPLAEMMLERGIRIVDSDGVGWKPRLTTVRKK